MKIVDSAGNPVTELHLLLAAPENPLLPSQADPDAPRQFLSVDLNRRNETPPPGTIYETLVVKIPNRTPKADVSAAHAIINAYPAHRRTGRDKAVKLIMAAIEGGETPEAIMAGLEAQKVSQGWLKSGGQFIPGLCRWLSDQGWRNEVVTPAPRDF